MSELRVQSGKHAQAITRVELREITVRLARNRRAAWDKAIADLQEHDILSPYECFVHAYGDGAEALEMRRRWKANPTWAPDGAALWKLNTYGLYLSP